MFLKKSQVEKWGDLNQYLTVDTPKLRNNRKALDAYHAVSTAEDWEIRQALTAGRPPQL